MAQIGQNQLLCINCACFGAVLLWGGLAQGGIAQIDRQPLPPIQRPPSQEPLPAPTPAADDTN